MKMSFVFFLVILMFQKGVFAGVLIEPFVGFEGGEFQQTGQAKIIASGGTYGARLGFDFWGFVFGGEISGSDQEAEQSDVESNYEPTDVGAFLGFQFPFGVQIYATYFFDSKAKLDSETYPEKFTGTGSRVGIGWTGIPFLSLNLEALNRVYDKYDSIKLDDKIKGQFYLFTVSVPLP